MTAVAIKKTSPNGKIALYLNKREFKDNLTSVEPVDGVVVVSEDYLQDRHVSVQLVTEFRYGREDDEVMGLSFVRELCLASLSLMYAHAGMTSSSLTEFQEDLCKKNEKSALPFHIDWPRGTPPSMVLWHKEYKGALCGMQHQLQISVQKDGETRVHKRSSLSLTLRVTQILPELQDETTVLWGSLSEPSLPATLISHPFLFSHGKLHLELCLEKAFLQAGDPLIVNVSILNHSYRSVKKIKTSFVQAYEVSFASGRRKQYIAKLESCEGCPIMPGSTLNRSYTLVTDDIQESKLGLAVNSLDDWNDINIAASTLSADSSDSTIFGFIVTYYVKVKLVVDPLTTVIAKLPIIVISKDVRQRHSGNTFPARQSCSLAYDLESGNVLFADFSGSSC